MHRLALALVSAAATGAIAFPRVEMELVPLATVTDAQVTLGDIVRLQSDDLAVVRRLVNLPVGQAPSPGESALVRRETLADWIRQTTGIPGERLHWSGADAARVVRTARQLRGEEIADAAMEAVRRGMAASGQHAELRVRTTPRDVEVPVGRVQLLPRPPASGLGLRNRVLVWVDAWVEDRYLRSFPIHVEVSGLSSHPGALTVGAGTSAMANQTAQEADAPSVSRGEWAALRTRSGAVALESRVEVLQDGRLGQRVRVRASTGAGSVLFAKVVGRSQLELAP